MKRNDDIEVMIETKPVSDSMQRWHVGNPADSTSLAGRLTPGQIGESVRHIRRYLRMSIVGVENICDEKSEYLANKHLWIQENANCEKKNRNICRYLLPPTFQIPNIPSPMLHAIQHKTRKGKVFEKKTDFWPGEYEALKLFLGLW